MVHIIDFEFPIDTNIDRILALWQATHPTRWFPEKTPEGFGPNDPLYPFRSYAQGGWWTSNTSKKCEDLGYVYPELQQSNDPKTVFSTVGKNYIWSLQQRPPGFGSEPPEEMKPLALATMKVFDYGNGAPVKKLGEWAMSSLKRTKPMKFSRMIMTKDSAADAEAGKPEKPAAELKVPDGATPIRQWYVDSKVKK